MAICYLAKCVVWSDYLATGAFEERSDRLLVRRDTAFSFAQTGGYAQRRCDTSVQRIRALCLCDSEPTAARFTDIE